MFRYTQHVGGRECSDALLIRAMRDQGREPEDVSRMLSVMVGR